MEINSGGIILIEPFTLPGKGFTLMTVILLKHQK